MSKFEALEAFLRCRKCILQMNRSFITRQSERKYAVTKQVVKERVQVQEIDIA